jgi:hypothetical protein
MGYVNDAVGVNYITIDGYTVYSHVLQLSEHLLGYQYATCETGVYDGAEHEVCFGVDNNANCWSNLGDNWFVDYVETNGGIPPWDDDYPTGVAEMSISTVKALY